MIEQIPPYIVGDLGGDLGGDVRRTAPAAARNVGAIVDMLAKWLPSTGLVLEVASGTGEHALAFARGFPDLDWQPSDPDPQALASIDAWRVDGPSNLRAPLALDATDAKWAIARADALLCINMVHISPWSSAMGLLDGAARLLPGGAPLILYGPWLIDGVATAPSNLMFDADLRTRNSEWGLRRLSEFQGAAGHRGLNLDHAVDMPANNVMLLFRRAAPAVG